VAYMVTGSVASSLQGEPRLTHDVDLVVALMERDLDKVLAAFPRPDYCAERDTALDAVRDRRMFNVIELATGGKLDFWMLTPEPFDRSRFERRLPDDSLGYPLRISSPEDTILAKLRWMKASGGSEKQFSDALHVFEVQGRSLDSGYIDRWSIALGVADLWDRLRREAELL
jgi:hypothetical protein